MSTQLDRVPYINLRSYKRDGGAVDTPVWTAPLDGKLYVFTLRESFKVKRIARNPKVQVAKCDVRGKLLGPWLDGECREIEKGSDLEKRAYDAFIDKYGLTMRIGNIMSTLAGRMKRRVMLEIALAPQAG
jgi:PPOX class probable F420-dependent enzyme